MSTKIRPMFLTFLNCLCLCLVRHGDEDAVSIAVSFRDHSVTLHIATDEGIPDQADLENAEHFFSVARDIFHQQNELAAKNEPFAFTHDVDRIEHAIVDAVWMRFLKKASLLRFTAVQNEDELHSLLRSWAEWRTQANQGNESSKRISSLATALSNGDNNAMLRFTFDFISDLEHAPQASESHDLKFRYFSRMTSLCSALINSDFFDDAINRRWPFARTSLLIQLLYRRLWRVYSYHHGAVRFAKVGLAHFRSLCGGQGTLEYVWAGHKLGMVPQVVNYPMPLRDAVIGILRRRSIIYTDKEPDEWLQIFSEPTPLLKTDHSWLEGGNGTLRPQSQIQMTHYLDA
ncbi:hypothetical protein EDD85DRAFT_449124 [Armillaria nabsnona]|nr:hypothetical protein EDD85DRAFT_449124 [Armillaria nabsnona]